MKQLFFSAVFALFVSVSFGQAFKDVPPPPAAPASKAVMTFEDGNNDTSLDFGKIAQKSDPLRRVKFTNTGTEPLVIKNARGSCGCTVPDWPKEPILPGETGYIDVRYDTNRIGGINKRVTITTNEEIQHTITVLGEVLKPVEEKSAPSVAPSLISGDN